MITREDEKTIPLNPPPGSAAARAVEFGMDLTSPSKIRLTPEERIRKLDDHLAGIAKLKGTGKFLHWTDEASTTSESRRKDLMVIAELEAIQEWQLIRANKRLGEKLGN